MNENNFEHKTFSKEDGFKNSCFSGLFNIEHSSVFEWLLWKVLKYFSRDRLPVSSEVKRSHVVEYLIP